MFIDACIRYIEVQCIYSISAVALLTERCYCFICITIEAFMSLSLVTSHCMPALIREEKLHPTC